MEAGLINAAQATSIQEFESEKGSRPYAMYSFVILGVAVISVGLISLIAANWEFIPDSIKLLGDFLILAGTGTAIYYFRDRLLFYALSVFYSLFILASIGLISQVFHTSGQLYEAVGLALFLTAPLMLFQKGRFLTHLWLLGFCFVFLNATYDHFEFENEFELNLVHMLSLGSILLLISLLFRNQEATAEVHSRATLFWALAALTFAAFSFSFLDFLLLFMFLKILV